MRWDDNPPWLVRSDDPRWSRRRPDDRLLRMAWKAVAAGRPVPHEALPAAEYYLRRSNRWYVRLCTLLLVLIAGAGVLGSLHGFGSMLVSLVLGVALLLEAAVFTFVGYRIRQWGRPRPTGALDPVMRRWTAMGHAAQPG